MLFNFQFVKKNNWLYWMQLNIHQEVPIMYECLPSRDIAGASASFMELNFPSVLDVAASKSQKLQILGLF